NVVLQVNLHSRKAFTLHPQQHHDISSAQPFFDMPRYVNARRKCGRNLRHQFRGTTERHPDSHSREQITSAACHTAMKDVANDRCLQPFERFLVLQNCQGVEMCLGRMLVHPITGIDYWYVKMHRLEMGRSL